MQCTILRRLSDFFHTILYCEYHATPCIITREGLYLHPGPKALKFAEDHGEDARGYHNTEAHLISSIIGRNVTAVIEDGELDLGEYGFIYFIDWDKTRGRTRIVQIMIIGE